MKPQTRDYTLQQHGRVLSSNDMTITATPEMFDLLSSGIYKNPIKAVVREYLANAVDESNTIDVTAPSSLVPYFKVRDYGKGMSSDFVMQLFSSYGVSTKQDTNDAIGGFGIGSKSAFAYTNSFTVRSWYQGGVSTYECTRNQEGRFVISLRGSRYSEDPSGTEIIVPCKAQDYSKFQEEINWYCSFLSHFRGCTFNGIDKDSLIKFEQMGELWKWDRATHFYTPPPTKFYIVMGGIPYEYSYTLRNDLLYGSNYVLEKPIGSVSIQASRESIRNSEDTDTVLTAAIKSATDSLLKHHYDTLSKCKTAWDKFIYWNTLDSPITSAVGHHFVDLQTASIKRTNRAGSLSYAYGNRLQNREYYLLDTDKRVPSRLKQVLNPNVIVPNGDIKDTIKELKELGVPYKLVSDIEPPPIVRQAKKTTKSGTITKGEALVVYFRGKRSYYDQAYSKEEKLDLDNPGEVWYYDRAAEGGLYEGVITNYLSGYQIVSATSKNLTKLQSAGIPHVKELLKTWASDNVNEEWVIRAYINEHMKSKIKYKYKYLTNGYRIGYGNSGEFSFSIRHTWKNLPLELTSIYDPSTAKRYLDDLDSKLKYIESLTLTGMNGATVPVMEHLDWTPELRQQLGLED